MAVLTLSEKLDQLGTRYDELTKQLSTSEIVSDTSHFQKVAKQHAELEQIVEKHREFKQVEKDLAGLGHVGGDLHHALTESGRVRLDVGVGTHRINTLHCDGQWYAARPRVSVGE